MNLVKVNGFPDAILKLDGQITFAPCNLGGVTLYFLQHGFLKEA